MKNGDCIFCKIVNRKIPSEIIYEDNDFLAFLDINPKAKIHILLIPKVHIVSLNELNSGEILLKVKELAKQEGMIDSYRVNINVGRKSGQEVDHLHLHILSNF